MTGHENTASSAISAPRIDWLHVENYRSIGEFARLEFPADAPLVLLGENNAGKSNLSRAIDILLGERWPTTLTMEDHDYFGRDSDGVAIKISAGVRGLPCSRCRTPSITHLKWLYDPQNPKSAGDIARFDPYCGQCRKNIYPSKEMRSSLFAMRIDADRRLSYQLSYASRYTLLSRLMHKFHERLLRDPARKDRLENLFNALVTEFDGVDQFATFRELLAGTAADLGRGMTYGLDIDFSAYDPSNFFRSLRVFPKLAGEVRSFDELGTGQEQILALAFAFAYARAFGHEDGLVLIVDEPEAHLHPLAQEWLAMRLSALVTGGLQVVLTTHSPYFVDLAKPGSYCVVRKVDSQTRVSRLPPEKLAARLVALGAGARTTPESVGPFYAAARTDETVAGMFGRACVLVEGRTEALALPPLLRLAGLDVLKLGIAVVSVDGLGNMAKWHRLYKAHDLPTFSIFDTDEVGGQIASDKVKPHEDILSALGVTVETWEAAADTRQALDVADEFATLHPTFEPAMSSVLGPRWDVLIEESIPVVGTSKPLQGRYAAELLTLEDLPEAARTALSALAEAVSQIVPVPEATIGVVHDQELDLNPDDDGDDSDYWSDDAEDYEPDEEDVERMRPRSMEEDDIR